MLNVFRINKSKNKYFTLLIVIEILLFSTMYLLNFDPDYNTASQLGVSDSFTPGKAKDNSDDPYGCLQRKDVTDKISVIYDTCNWSYLDRGKVKTLQKFNYKIVLTLIDEPSSSGIVCGSLGTEKIAGSNYTRIFNERINHYLYVPILYSNYEPEFKDSLAKASVKSDLSTYCYPSEIFTSKKEYTPVGIKIEFIFEDPEVFTTQTLFEVDQIVRSLIIN